MRVPVGRLTSAVQMPTPPGSRLAARSGAWFGDCVQPACGVRSVTGQNGCLTASPTCWLVRGGVPLSAQLALLSARTFDQDHTPVVSVALNIRKASITPPLPRQINVDQSFWRVLILLLTATLFARFYWRAGQQQSPEPDSRGVIEKALRAVLSNNELNVACMGKGVVRSRLRHGLLPAVRDVVGG
jgi:hypothetical protein